jgi:hypothetical protein
MKLRRVFNYDNLNQSKILNTNNYIQLYTNSITATGCLFYKIVDGIIWLLLIKYINPEHPLLDDFGGKADITDMTIMQTIMRELSEETNGVIAGEYIEHLVNESPAFYNKQSKYYVKVVCVDDSFYPDTTVFGDFEGIDYISRTVSWYKFNEVRDKLAHRLQLNNELMRFLDSLQITS